MLQFSGSPRKSFFFFRLNTCFDLLIYFWFLFWFLNYKVFQFDPITFLPFTILVIYVSFFQKP
ncbi:hypothetical protein MtrunA17_Chr4g0065121 [Medicago truncatula]|uniref:Transmembrane protein n=1 Tax=Medicago truncatula TaxID=3880 RepID=A0A396IEQ2_MEDTR|nr:hypothetical protein MtrunA17_Chr4g0065121 [Medicago truncatula]